MKENSTANADKPAAVSEQMKEQPQKEPAKKEAADKTEKDSMATAAKASEKKKTEKTGKKKVEEKKEKEKPKRDLVLERIYSVPLSRAFRSSKQWRANTACRLLRDFCAKHAKTGAANVKIGTDVNEFVRANGKNSVPRKVKVKIAKDKEGIATVELAK